MSDSEPCDAKWFWTCRFSCPLCESRNIVGCQHRAFDKWPAGYHLTCGTCRSEWFLAIKETESPPGSLPLDLVDLHTELERVKAQLRALEEMRMQQP